MTTKLDPSKLTSEKLKEFTEADDPSVLVRHYMGSLSENMKARGVSQYDRTPQNAKDVYETIDLIQQIIQKEEAQEGKIPEEQVRFTYRDVDFPTATKIITAEVIRREPGSFAEGPPFQGDVKNYRPVVRETLDDPEEPGYKTVVMGYFFDNLIRLTCWAQTNKAANDLSVWLEKVMFKYSWYLRYCGVNKILYYGRDREMLRVPSQNNLHGRPLNFFVRTEMLMTVSQKSLTRVIIDINKVPSGI